MVEPVAATIIAYGWLAEALGPAQLIGGAVVITGVILAETSRA
jgi:drug/metabolite transporter (DMT)-like permease